MIPLLILRPEPGASATAVRARAHGLEAIVAPLFAIHPLAWTPPDPEALDAVLMTSANAARHGGPGLDAFRHLPLYAVGSATADAAREAGFTEIHTGSGDGDAALGLARAHGHARLFHPAGRDHVPTDPQGAIIERRLVYASDRLDPPPLSGQRIIALLHSTRAAHVFAERCGPRGAIAIVAISAAVTAAAGTGWHQSVTAATPDDESMLAAAARLCDHVFRGRGSIMSDYG